MKLEYWLAATILVIAPGLAPAQNYPTKPIRIVVGFVPGGGSDITARFVARRLTEAFGQTAVVDNRAGAGTIIGTDIVAKSAPDGYTLLVTHNAIAINQTLYPKLPYNTVRDFAQVAIIGITTNALVVNPGVPARTVKDLVALAKAKPGGLNYASSGAGGISHLSMEYFKLLTGTNIVQIPYKGSGPALTDMLSGQTQLMISTLPSTLPFTNSKRLVALATTGAKRSSFSPDVPTLKEAGVAGYEFDTWYGVHAPAKTPRDIIAKLNTVIVKSLAVPEFKQQLTNQGIETGDSTPEEFSKFVRAEVDKMAKIIKASGARPE